MGQGLWRGFRRDARGVTPREPVGARWRARAHRPLRSAITSGGRLDDPAEAIAEGPACSEDLDLFEALSLAFGAGPVLA